MKLIKLSTSFFVLMLIFVIPSSFLSAKEAKVERLDVLQLPPMRVTTSPGDIEILIVRQGLEERFNAIKAIMVTKVRPGSIYAKCGITPGMELVSIQGIEFVGTDYSKEEVIKMLSSTEILTPYFEFEVCKSVSFQNRQRGPYKLMSVVRKEPIQPIRVPVLNRTGTRVVAANE